MRFWSFCYSKAKNVPEEHRGTFGYGDVWTWTAICADTKLVPCWLVGERTTDDAWTSCTNLKDRLVNRVQLTTDGHRAYLSAVDFTFGDDVDFAMLHKLYGPADGTTHQERKYSPNVCTGIDVRIVKGDPDPGEISTSYVERQNLTMRMGMRPFTRLTNGFKEGREPGPRRQPALHALQLRPRPPVAHRRERGRHADQAHPGDGSLRHRPRWMLREIAALLDSN